jgi:branched-chain amino acid transport system permease protein
MSKLPITITEGSRNHLLLRYIPWTIFGLVVLVAPFWAAHTPSLSISDSTFTFSLGNLNHAVAFMVGVLGIGLLVGFNGQISLGNSFFMGVGGYLTATLVVDNDWPYLATLVVVLPVCFIIGMLVGLPALRIKGLYLALTTLGLAAVFPSIVRMEQLRDRTGGANGKRIDSRLDAPDWVPLETMADFLSGLPLVGEWAFGDGGIGGRAANAAWVYFLLVALTAAAFWVTRNLVYSRPGRSIIAIRDNETGAAVNGVNVPMTKTLTFGFSAALGGLSGTMYAMAIGFVAPDVFGINLAIFLIVGLVVGGVGTLSGAVIGGIVIVFVPVWSAQIDSMPGLPDRFLRGPTGIFFLGLLLIVLTFFLPGGIVFGMRKIRARFVHVVPPREVGGIDEVLVSAGDATGGKMSRHGGGSALDLDEDVIDPDGTDHETGPGPVSASAQQPNQGEPT